MWPLCSQSKKATYAREIIRRCQMRVWKEERATALQHTHAKAKNVRLQLRKEVAIRDAAIDPKLSQFSARVALHGLENLGCLDRDRLERGTTKVRLRNVLGQADNHSIDSSALAIRHQAVNHMNKTFSELVPARIRAPIRRKQARERRYKVHAAVVVDRLRKCHCSSKS